MIIALDFRTIVFCTSALGAFISVAMVYVACRRRVYPGFHEWTLSYMTAVLGVLISCMNQAPPAFFTTVAGNTLLVGGFLIFGIGLRKFVGIRQQPWIDIGIIITAIFVFTFYAHLSPSIIAQIIALSIMLGLITLRHVIISIRDVPSVLGSPNSLLTATLATLFLLYLVRAIATPAMTANTNDITGTGSAQATVVLASSLLTTILALALITINAQRFQHDLQRSQERYRRLIEEIQIDFYLYSHDLNGVFTYLTPSIKDLFETDPENMIGRNWRTVFRLSPKMTAIGDRIDDECRNGRYPPPFEFSFRHPTKGKYTLEAQKRPVFDSMGNVVAIEGIAKDITQQKKVEKALRESEEKYRTLVENVGVGIIIMQNLHFVYANDLVRKNMGIPPESRLEQVNPFNFVHTDDQGMVIERQKARVQGDKVPANYTFQWLLPDGRSMWLEATDVRIEWNGRPATLNFVTDITARKNMEAERDLLIQELQTALGEVQTLSGLLPICAHCKKIRDDSGYWTQVEQYIKKHSQAEFSHGICPECMQELYAELSDHLENSNRH